MALRDQPYIPLMVKDWLTDEKLKECSASSLGVYVYIMCAMHKSREYGTILLKQKNKQTSDQIENFALKIQKHMHFSLQIIYDALTELIDEDVVQLDVKNNKITQKRMIKDNNLSIIRSEAGSKGGKKTQFAKAKRVANTVTANTSVNATVNKAVIKVKPLKIKYAEKVYLTEKEYHKIKDKYFNGSKELMDKAIETLDAYKESKGKIYASDAGAIRSWVVDKLNEKSKTKQSKQETITEKNLANAQKVMERMGIE